MNLMDRDAGQGGALLRKKVLIKGHFSEHMAQDIRGFSMEYEKPSGTCFGRDQKDLYAVSGRQAWAL